MKKLVAAFILFFSASLIFADSILTANAFFDSISEYYATIKDYEAEVEIKIPQSKEVMTGKISFKRPEMLRIDFTKPEEQVILFDGDKLTVYLPGSASILEQTIEKSNDTASATASIATPQGLSLMSRYYSIQYESGQQEVPLEPESDEMVVNLILSRKSSAEAFRELKVSVNPATKLLRRIVAVTPQGDEFIFNFFEYELNVNINEARFLYNPPSSANNYNNFLFSE